MKLSKSTSYAINWLYTQGKGVDYIADELDLQAETVQKYIEKNSVQDKVELATKSKPVKSSKDLMIRHTRDKKTNNVAIMTREASAFNDDAKKKFPSKNDNNEHIFKPNK
jgi:DNA-binding transcriptional regulator LsrR (DeoR family)